MSLKKLGIILFLIFSLLPIQKIFAQTANTGFVSANIWYSKDPFEEGDKIKIYTLIFNPDARELSGTVFFFDNTILLGKKDFTIAAKTADDISIDWTVNAGDHTIFGKIENAKFLVSKGKYEEVYLAENQTEKSSRTVSKKIISNATNTKSNSQTNDPVSSVISDIKIITDKTPDFITQPIASATNTLEQFRTNANLTANSKTEEVKNEIKTLDNAPVTLDSKTATSTLLKPFKYAELFFLSVFSFIFNNKILFYGILAIIVFSLLRSFWKIFF
jgi:hypothetical protein